MTNPTPAILDRLAHRATALGLKIKRSALLEIAASALGYRNSNEMTAAAKAGELKLYGMAEPIGRFTLPDGQAIIILNDPLAGSPYGIDESFIDQTVDEERRESIGVSPYGHLLDLTSIGDTVLTDLGAASVPANPSAEFVIVRRSDLETVVAAASSYSDDVSTGIEDGVNDEDPGLEEIDNAIGSLQFRLDQEPSPPVDSKPTTDGKTVRMHVASIDHKHGTNRYVAFTQADLYRQLAEYVRGEWHEVSDLAGAPASADGLDDFDAVTRYFELMADTTGSQEYLDTSVDDVALPEGYTFAPSNEVVALASAELAGRPADWASQIADALENGAGSEIWYDAHEFGEDEEDDPDRIAENTIEETQNAMYSAAKILRGLVAPDTVKPTRTLSMSGVDQQLEPIYLTDADGESTGQVNIEQISHLSLPHGSDRVAALTPKEEAFLGAGVVLNAHELPVRLGFSVLWKGAKWLAPDIEFGWDESQPDPDGTGYHSREAALGRAQAYINSIKTDIEALGGSIRLNADAIDYAHEVAVLIPFDIATESASPEDWQAALSYLLADRDLRESRPQVTAEFTAEMWFNDNAMSVDPQGDTVWDVTFDVLQNGANHAIRILDGLTDTDSYRDSPFAPKWIREWDSNPFTIQLIGVEEALRIAR